MSLYDPYEAMFYRASMELERAQVAAKASMQRAYVEADAARESAQIRASAMYDTQRRKEESDKDLAAYKANVSYNLQENEHRIRRELEQIRNEAAAQLAQSQYRNDWYLQDKKGKDAMNLAAQNARSALALEDRQHQHHQERDQFNAEVAYNTEAIRGRNALDLESLQAHNRRVLEQDKHFLKVAEMEIELRHRALMNGIELGTHAMQKLMSEDGERRKGLTQTYQQVMSSQIQNCNALVNAVITEKLAQKQHKRDMELATHKSGLQRVESYWNTVFTYILRLLEGRKLDQARDEIERILGDWESV